jgi:dTDP-4-amino-4,6-dideoxygalactose transaminase
VAADVSPESWNIDPAAVRKVVTDKTRAILAINTFGVPAPVEDLMKLGIPVIEDCAHALGMKSRGEWLGSRGTLGVCSFYATKLVGGGEGGAVLSNDASLSAFVEEWRDYADAPAHPRRLNEKMSDLEAALVLCQLSRLKNMIRARRQKAMRYTEKLADWAQGTGLVRLPDITAERIWYRYVVAIRAGNVDEVVSAMRRRGVQACRPVSDWRKNRRDCPHARFAYDHLVSLPLYPTLTDREQDAVCRTFTHAVQEFDRHG